MTAILEKMDELVKYVSAKHFESEKEAALWVYQLMVNANESTPKASTEVNVKDVEEILGYDFNFNYHKFF